MIAAGAVLLFLGWGIGKLAPHLLFDEARLMLMQYAGRRSFTVPWWVWVPRALCLFVGGCLFIAGVATWLWRLAP